MLVSLSEYCPYILKMYVISGAYLCYKHFHLSVVYIVFNFGEFLNFTNIGKGEV